MKKGKTLPKESLLRQKTEAIIKKLNSGQENQQAASIGLSSTEAEMQKLIHELHVNQIELERQNSELQNAVKKAATAIALYDFAPTGYFTVKPDSAISQLNLSGAKMLGKGRLHLRNSRLNDFIAPDSQPVFTEFLQKCFETSLKQTCEIGLAVHGKHSSFLYLEGMVTEDGLECLVVAVDITKRKRAEAALKTSEEFNGRFYSTTKFPIQVEERPNFLAGFTIDITEQKVAEQALKESEARLRELNATKDKFFSIIAHDLRSPFNGIMGVSSLLATQIQERDYGEIEKYAAIIQNSSQQALDLLMNLLEWSRLQTGRMVFNPECINIVALINQASELLNASAQEKSITVYLQIPANIPVFADQAMISTILRNLISNAIKFTGTGGEIVISTEQKSTELVISVLDSGVGMNKESIGKLFRIDENNSTLGTQNEKGTGLGLLLCKEFIDKHGGRIWVESEPEKGSRFFFSIPCGISASSSF